MLDLEQRRIYVPIGIGRYVKSRRNRWTFNGYDRPNAMAIDVAAAGAELQAALTLGAVWTGRDDTFKGPDVGQRTQVRWTELEHGCLLVRESDPLDHIYVLVTGREPDFVLPARCWMWGHEPRRPEWWRPPSGNLRGVWFAPQEALRALHDLEGIVL